MLTLTDNAVTAIEDLIQRSPDGATGGIRIDTEPADHSGKLGVEFADSPKPGDQVIEKAGARVFLDSDAAPTLATKELDVIVRERNLKFTLRERG